MSTRAIDGVLLDIDGVLTVSWKPLPGAPATLGWLRDHRIPFALATNTSTLSRSDLARTLRQAGLDVSPEELVTAPVAAAAYLRQRHPRARVFLLGEPSTVEDLEGVTLVDDGADVVLVAGADDAFTWENLNRAFRMLRDGAALVAMHRNLYWMTDEGLSLDAGAFVTGLEQAAGVTAVVTGKPAQEFFAECTRLIGVDAGRVAMVGDDLDNDVLAAQRHGLMGVLVRTGKFLPEVLDRASEEPDQVIDSIRDLPGLVGRMR